MHFYSTVIYSTIRGELLLSVSRETFHIFPLGSSVSWIFVFKSPNWHYTVWLNEPLWEPWDGQGGVWQERRTYQETHQIHPSLHLTGKVTVSRVADSTWSRPAARILRLEQPTPNSLIFTLHHLHCRHRQELLSWYMYTMTALTAIFLIKREYYSLKESLFVVRVPWFMWAVLCIYWLCILGSHCPNGEGEGLTQSRDLNLPWPEMGWNT